MSSKKFSYQSIIAVCALLFSLAFVVWWSVPAIPKGTENINVIMHFDPDEGTTVDFYSKFYKNVFLTPTTIAGYPTGFYYVAGAFLFPYSFLHPLTDNQQAIVITFRALNTFFVLLTIVLIYFLALYHYRSAEFIAFLFLLLIFTSNCLWWSISYRPHPFEIFLMFISLFLALIWIEKKKFKYLLGSLLLAALAFGVKYGGMFILPAIFLFLMRNFYQMNKEKLSQFTQKYFLIGTLSSLGLVISGLTLIFSFYHYFVPLAVRITHIGASLGEAGLKAQKLFKSAVISLWCVVILGLFWLGINIYCKKIINKREKNNSPNLINNLERFILLADAGFLSVFGIAVLFVLAFSITNPHSVFHPIVTLRSFFGLGLLEFSFSSQGEGYLRELWKNFQWFPMLSNIGLLGVSGTVALIWYFLYEFINWRKNLLENKTKMLQRIFIWVYILTNLLFLITLIKFRTHHYLLMVTYLLFFLIVYAVSESIYRVKNLSLKLCLLSLFLALSTWSLWERAPEVIRLRRDRMNVNSDAGLYIGKWLEDTYGEDVKIWKDAMEFYIPPKFKNVFFAYGHEDINQLFIQINETKPDVLIVTSKFDNSLNNKKKVIMAIEDGTLKGYQLLKVFKYSGPLYLNKFGGKYREIAIFARVSNGDSLLKKNATRSQKEQNEKFKK